MAARGGIRALFYYQMKQYIKKHVLTILLVGIVVFLGYFLFIPNPDASYSSPDGNYHLDCYTSMSLLAMPGGGGVDSRVVLIILRDKYGREIGRCSKNNPCATFFGSLDIRWETDEGVVWYTRSRIIDLSTGEPEC